MTQVKIYALRFTLNERERSLISEAIHQSLKDAFKLPENKRFQRFFPLEPEDFIFSERSDNYLIIEIIMFAGRSIEAKKLLYKELYFNLDLMGRSPKDVEIVLLESPRENWGIRGKPGDELQLDYPVDI